MIKRNSKREGRYKGEVRGKWRGNGGWQVHSCVLFNLYVLKNLMVLNAVSRRNEHSSTFITTKIMKF